MSKAPVMLLILDGFGLTIDNPGNAIGKANKPYYDKLWEDYPTTILDASGERVGLPKGQMGNSEVGHLNLGAGRVVYQELTRISKSIETGTFGANEELTKLIKRVEAEQTALHLMGLLSDGGVHSHLDHLYALLELAKRNGMREVYIHAFLDGRDVAPDSGLDYIRAVEERCEEIGVGKIATVTGRYWAMDRDNRWERIAKAYQALVLGEGEKATFARVAVEQSYDKRVLDEFVEPTVIVDKDGAPTTTIAAGDGLIFFNFRADRARQITRAFVDEDFVGFERPKGFLPIHFCCLTQYDATINAPVAFSPQNLDNTLGEVLSKAGYKQLRIAETEKYAHVTFFFNGGVEEPNLNEERILIPSPKVATYNLKPEMSAFEVAERAVAEIDQDIYDVIILNFANPDMVGHTGDLEAAVKAVEKVDKCLQQVVDKVLTKGGTVLLTSDHGNAEEMLDDNKKPYTAHTKNLVPFILISDRLKDVKLETGKSLEDVAPTMLELLGVHKPKEMTGTSIIMGENK
ncbi:MAG: 2,3-bisphosphoglycerate-independent phosphoglycerate mutase [Bacillota bacterium]|nr:2,3-bisphosphoglycerate-independent phosphoglycerate mutase [Bacillota bacterium]